MSLLRLYWSTRSASRRRQRQETFIAAHPDAFAPESGAWGRSGSTRVRLAAVDEDTLGEALTLACQNTVSKNTSKTKRRPVADSRARNERRKRALKE